MHILIRLAVLAFISAFFTLSHAQGDAFTDLQLAWKAGSERDLRSLCSRRPELREVCQKSHILPFFELVSEILKNDLPAQWREVRNPKTHEQRKRRQEIESLAGAVEEFIPSREKFVALFNELYSKKYTYVQLPDYENTPVLILLLEQAMEQQTCRKDIKDLPLLEQGQSSELPAAPLDAPGQLSMGRSRGGLARTSLQGGRLFRRDVWIMCGSIIFSNALQVMGWIFLAQMGVGAVAACAYCAMGCCVGSVFCCARCCGDRSW